ncbi:hypothetical protein MSPP1_001822 [Malassezia sp. CBS 17886]|nr:hypothetical protein MSPP1_001822 [Malassezia sp. CBS 17886]
MHAPDVPRGPRQRASTVGRKMWGLVDGGAKRLVDYDATEANRLGIPMVGIGDFVQEHWRNPVHGVVEYLENLFPVRRWILSYNLNWLSGDVIAGITVGMVLVPQSMSYANVAGLAPQFGLYSSFVGVMIYAFFATSKDVTIGPVAVMSLQTHTVIQKVTGTMGDKYSPQLIASALAFLCGIITLGVGLLRLGWLVEFIPAPAVSGFMTGSALTIAAGQFPKLFGMSQVHTNTEAMYQVTIDFFRNLPNTSMDAAFGIPALVFLYFVRWSCGKFAARYPRYARIAFFVSVLRSAAVIIIFTIASRVWLGGYDPADYPISLIKHVPRGFQDMGQPQLPTTVLSEIAPNLPASVIVLLLEHIAIAKSFGRLNNYKINANQELIAIGVTNLVGPCFGGYAATGSFSRSAIKSKSGVRSPLAGWITGIVVLIAIYALPGVFYWIPNATLSAVIIHAVFDLIAPPALLYKFWLMNPLELVIWTAAVLVTVFTSVDYGVYTSIAASAVLLLVRIARPRGYWLGIVHVQHHDTALSGRTDDREVFVPMDVEDGLRDPSVQIRPPPPGILIYRVEESFTYPNASHMAEVITDKVRRVTRPGASVFAMKRGERPWNDPGPPNPWIVKTWRTLTFYGKRHKGARAYDDEMADEKGRLENDPRPLLHALIFDFGSVSNVDSTSVQVLVDLRNTLERYSGRAVEFHFAVILSPWIRRALLAGGFGTGAAHRHVTEIASVVPQRDARDIVHRIAQKRADAARATAKPTDDLEAGTSSHGSHDAPADETTPDERPSTQSDLNMHVHGAKDDVGYMDKLADYGLGDLQPPSADNHEPSGGVVVPVMWNNELTPYFHLDLAAALSSVEDAQAV